MRGSLGVDIQVGDSDLDNQICILVHAGFRGCVAGNNREGLRNISSDLR